MDRGRIPFWRALLAGIIVLLTGLASWQLTVIFLRLDVPLRGWSLGFALGVIHASMTFFLTESLLALPIKARWAYRGAFLISAAWGFLFWFRHPYAWFLLLVVFLSSFLGALMATR